MLNYNTTFKVYHPSIAIRIGERNIELDKLLQEHQALTWAYITAYNPFSQPLTEVENDSRHEQLMSHLKNYILFEGEGVGENKTWKPEKSFLIVGIGKKDAKEIGKKFGQNAIVFGMIAAPAELIILEH